LIDEDAEEVENRAQQAHVESRWRPIQQVFLLEFCHSAKAMKITRQHERQQSLGNCVSPVRTSMALGEKERRVRKDCVAAMAKQEQLVTLGVAPWRASPARVSSLSWNFVQNTN